MWTIRKLIRKRDYDYALVPKHPKATKNGYENYTIISDAHLWITVLENNIMTNNKNKLVNVAKYLNDGWKPAVEDTAWYIISYGNNNIDIVNDYFQHSSCSSRIIFKTKELAQQAIKILGEETVKLALEPLGI